MTALTAADEQIGDGTELTLSVVIPNYNYGRFLGEAVDSALAIDWPAVEVIVVDDGSTDDSLLVLERFGDLITVLTQENSGPRVACNRGFAASGGDVVIFLDSDDLLDPSIARELARVWRPGITKVQTQMTRIGDDGRDAGGVFPDYRSTPTPTQVRDWILATSAYPTPPGSGNAYARDFLEQLFPLDDRCGDATDSACLAAAPLLGDVVTIAKPLSSYRLHTRNRSSLKADHSRFPAQIQRAYQRHRFALELVDESASGIGLKAVFRSRHLLQMRVAERRLFDGPTPIPGDGHRRMIRDTVACLWAPGPEAIVSRVMVSVWCLMTLGAPKPVALWLIRRRFK